MLAITISTNPSCFLYPVKVVVAEISHNSCFMRAVFNVFLIFFLAVVVLWS